MIRLDHIGVSVASLEEALGVFVDSLGCELLGRESINGVQVAFVRLAGVDLELVERADATPGLSHLGLHVDDLDRADIGRIEPTGDRIAGTRGAVVQLLDRSTSAGIAMHLCTEGSRGG